MKTVFPEIKDEATRKAFIAFAQEFNAANLLPVFGSGDVNLTGYANGATVTTIGLNVPQPGYFVSLALSGQIEAVDVTGPWSVGLDVLWNGESSSRVNRARNGMISTVSAAQTARLPIGNVRTVELRPGKHSIVLQAYKSASGGGSLALNVGYSYQIHFVRRVEARLVR